MVGRHLGWVCRNSVQTGGHYSSKPFAEAEKQQAEKLKPLFYASDDHCSILENKAWL